MTTECLDRVIALSFGRESTDVHPVLRELRFGELAAEFAHPDSQRGRLPSAEYHRLDKRDPEQRRRRGDEKDGAYFLPAKLRPGGKRCIADIEEMVGIALDFDSGATTEEKIRSVLDGLAYLAYTTYSSLPESQRWRVFIPYIAPIVKERHRLVYEHFQQRFDGDVDEHCGTPAQFSYTPACPVDAVDAFQSFACLGEAFDVSKLVLDTPTPMGKSEESVTSRRVDSSATQLGTMRQALKHVSADDRSQWVKVGLALKNDLGEAGLATWLEWSSTSAKFEVNDALTTWSSLSRSDHEPKVTLGTVIYLARANGWTGEPTANKPPEFVSRLNERYFVAPYGSSTLVFSEETSPLSGDKIVRMLRPADFRLLLMNQTVDITDDQGQLAKRPVANEWLKDPNRRQYDGVGFAPNRELPGYYNRWRGLAIQPREGDWHLLREHIYHVICRGEEAVFEFLLNWIAFCYQFPGRPAEVAIVLRGGQGTGKGMFARTIGKPLGQHFVHISNARHLTGNFNSHFSECVLLFADEAFWAGDKQSEAQLKRLITEPTLMIERKGFDSEMVQNCLHVLIASNSEWVIPAGVDERRFLVLDVDDAKQQNHAYFAALHREIENGGVEAMVFDLLKWDLSEFNPRDVPRTAALVNQKLLSLDPVQQWWFERLQVGAWLDEFGDSVAQWEQVPVTLVQKSFVATQRDVGRSHRSSQTELGVRLRRLLPVGYPKKSQRQLARDSGRVALYSFPSLRECRDHFSKLVDLGDFDWDGELAGEEG